MYYCGWRWNRPSLWSSLQTVVAFQHSLQAGASLGLAFQLRRDENTHGYHAITMGWLLARLVYNVTGKTLGTLFDEEIANPLNLDIHIGMEPRHHQRVARMELLSNNPPVLHKDILNL